MMGDVAITVRDARAGDEVPAGAKLVVEYDEWRGDEELLLVFDEDWNVLQFPSTMPQEAGLLLVDAARQIVEGAAVLAKAPKQTDMDTMTAQIEHDSLIQQGAEDAAADREALQNPPPHHPV